MIKAAPHLCACALCLHDIGSCPIYEEHELLYIVL